MARPLASILPALRGALTALLLCIAAVSALPGRGGVPFEKYEGSAFSAATVDMAVLPARAAARAVLAPLPLLPVMPPVVAVVGAVLVVPAGAAIVVPHPAGAPPPPFELRGPRAFPRAPPQS